MPLPLILVALGRGGEVADGARVVVADAEVEAEAVADGEGENVGADGELVAVGDDVEDGVRVLGAKGGEALRVVGGVVANVGKPDVLERFSGLVELMLRHFGCTASDDFLGRLWDVALDDGGLLVRPEDGARGEIGEDALVALGLVVARGGGVALAHADGGGGVWDGAGGGGRGGGGAADGSQVDGALRDVGVGVEGVVIGLSALLGVVVGPARGLLLLLLFFL